MRLGSAGGVRGVWLSGRGHRVKGIAAGGLESDLISEPRVRSDGRFTSEEEGRATNLCCIRRDHEIRTANLTFGFAAAVGQIQNDGFAIAFVAVVFIEEGLGDHILFAGPISQVAFTASFAAKWKIRVDC